MRTLCIIAVVLTIVLTSCAPDKPNPFVDSPKASISMNVTLGKIGGVNRNSSDIELSKIYITLENTEGMYFYDSAMISGSQQQTVIFKFKELIVNRPWNTYIYSIDTTGREIHYSYSQFILTAGRDTTIAIRCEARFSKLQANIFPIAKNFRRCSMILNEELVAEASFNPEIVKTDTMSLSYPYVDASPEGSMSSVRLNVFGILNDSMRLLYTGDSTITVYSGKNSRHRIKLYWVGDDSPNSTNLSMSVELGFIGTTIVDGEITNDTLKQPPTITYQPYGIGIMEGDSAFIYVVAKGSYLRYQWYKDSQAVSGATNAFIYFRPAQPSDEGMYSVVVNNPFGSVRTQPVMVRIYTKSPKIQRDLPERMSVSLRSPLRLSLDVNGNYRLLYGWYKNDSLLTPNDTFAHNYFQIRSVSFADSGTYHCIVRNQFGADTSIRCRVQITEANNPTDSILIYDRIRYDTISVGSKHVMEFSCVSKSPMLFQWYKDSTSIPGATQLPYEIPSATLAHAGSYSLRVTNAIMTVFSKPIHLTVIDDKKDSTALRR